MKQLNLSNKNLAILAAGTAAVGIALSTIAKALAKVYPNAYPKISYYLHQDRFESKESSLKVSQTNDQKADVELKLFHLNIKQSKMFNALMKFFFPEKTALKYFLQQKADTLAKNDVITTSADKYAKEGLDSLTELNSLLDKSTAIAYPVMAGTNQLTSHNQLFNLFAKAIGLVFASPEKHSKESITQFLKNVSATQTTLEVADILRQAEKLKIFSEFVKAAEKVGEESFKKLVTIFISLEQFEEDKLILFTKLVRSVDADKVDLNAIFSILECHHSSIKHFAYDSSKSSLAKLHETVTSNGQNAQAAMDEINLDTDRSKIFNLELDGDDLDNPSWVGIKSQGLKEIIGAEFDIGSDGMELSGAAPSASLEHFESGDTAMMGAENSASPDNGFCALS